jgi:hypothetical protein
LTEIVSVTPRSDATYPVVHARYFAPRTRSLDLNRLSFVFFSATPRQKVPRLPSSYVPARPCLSARCDQDQRYVRPTSAILHFKNEHPLFRAVTESLAGVSPGAPAWTEWFTPLLMARLGRRFLFDFASSAAGVLFPPRSGAPIPLTSPSPLELCPRATRAPPERPRPLPPPLS